MKYQVTLELEGNRQESFSASEIMVKMIIGQQEFAILQHGETFVKEGFDKHGIPLTLTIQKQHQSYWAGNGRYQKEYEIVKEARDSALNDMRFLYHDLYNNGGGNITAYQTELTELAAYVGENPNYKMIVEFWNTPTDLCGVCCGTGSDLCEICDGDAEVECDCCFGSGCEQCDGLGFVECDGHCFGSGEFGKCSDCQDGKAFPSMISNVIDHPIAQAYEKLMDHLILQAWLRYTSGDMK